MYIVTAAKNTYKMTRNDKMAPSVKAYDRTYSTQICVETIIHKDQNACLLITLPKRDKY